MVNLDTPLQLTERKIVRKQLAKLRDQGQVPAVIHNHGQSSVLVSGDAVLLNKIYHEAGKHHPLQLKVGSQDFLALIKDAHYHPAKRQLEHIVFQAIRRDEKVQAEVPIILEGDIPAEKAGLMVLHQLDHLEVEALPKDLPDELKADATVLAELHDKITVADLPIPNGVTVLTEADHPIATVIETKAQISEEEEAETEAVEGEEGAEGEAGEVSESSTEAAGDKGQASEAEQKEASGQETPKQ